MLPNELIIKIFEKSFDKHEMIEAFPWLKNETPKCSWCDNIAHFLVSFTSDDACCDCPSNVKTSEPEYLCKLNCENIYYVLEDQDIKNETVIATYLCDKDDCYNCGCRILYEVEAKGTQIMALPKSKPSRKVAEFIDKNMTIVDKNMTIVEDPKSVVHISQVLNSYKTYYNLTATNLSKKAKKQLNSTITKEFKKVLTHEKYYFVGVTLNSVTVA